jgi:2-polyprenyl-3-methyl-5-hydroxy-6-metoxy-1,4-benzoquinol methylase
MSTTIINKSKLNEFYGNRYLKLYQESFLPYLSIDKSGPPVLDLGCGQGTFLEILKDRGWQGVGIDLSEEAVTTCKSRGLDVSQSDAISYLSDKSESYSAILCSHLIEHLDYENACRLLRSCYQSLISHGRMILITPNPASLEVSEYFWLDPTHVRPYPLQLLSSMIEDAGFVEIASGQKTARGLPRRGIPRRFLLKLLLGRHYGKVDSYLVAEKP